MNEVQTCIHNRKSIRAYKPEQLSKADLDAILDAGIWAPTARHAQEIRFTVVQNPELMHELTADFTANDPRGAKFGNFYYSAPTFVFLSGPRDFPFTEIDGGIVVAHMALAAESVGAGSVIIGCICDFMESEHGKKWCTRLDIPETDKFVIGIALGYKDQDPPARERKDGRVFYH